MGDSLKMGAAASAVRGSAAPDDRMRGWRVCALLLTALALSGCGRFQSDFRADTEAGQIQLDVDQVKGASIDDVTQLRMRAGERAYERAFMARLPVGAQVSVSASVARFGVYRRGGSWVFEGQRFLGRHGIWATMLEATSSDPDIVAVQLEPLLDRPTHNRMVLHALRQGAARISLSVQALDGSGRPMSDERQSDFVLITVE